MKIKLINNEIKLNDPIQVVLNNRGVDYDRKDFFFPTEKELLNPFSFGEELVKKVICVIANAVKRDMKTVVIVDCDCDGYTSAAYLINYLHNLFPTWVENKLEYIMHDDKTHGLSDCVDYIIEKQYGLVLCPDAGSNDAEQSKKLFENNISVCIFDHHEVDIENPYAYIINNKCLPYENKDLSGVGVVYKFCQAIDTILNVNHCNKNLDLVALGLIADMVDLRHKETRYFITEGLKEENITNPFIYNLYKKNAYSIGEKLTPISAAFYIAPYVNAMTRSGTMEEKEILFNSMLSHKAFTKILSNKRGHSVGEEETIVEQAMRTVANVKKRQTTSQNDGMELLLDLIEENNLLDHKVIAIRIPAGQIDRGILGLCANKIMAKFKRCCCVLAETIDKETGEISYQGSARGYDKSGVDSFRDICLQTGLVQYSQGHKNAFGIGISSIDFDKFIEATDELLKDVDTEPVYYVDFLYAESPDIDVITELCDYESAWGSTGSKTEEPLVGLVDIPTDKCDIKILGAKANTINITLPNGLECIKFNVTQEEKDLVDNAEKLCLLGTCSLNKFRGIEKPQIKIKEMDIYKDNTIKNLDTKTEIRLLNF